MKGINLPVNIMIIVIIAVIVLIAVIALFMGVWGQSSSGIAIEAAKNNGCQRYISLGYCDETPSQSDVEGITINKVDCGGPVIDNLYDLATGCFGKNTIDEISELCNCH